MNKYLIPAILLSATLTRAEELPDISTIAPDLTVPEMTTGAPEAGRRVRYTTHGSLRRALFADGLEARRALPGDRGMGG
jgi:hypothetical protein